MGSFLIYNTYFMPHISFLKSEKFWFSKHTCPRGVQIRNCDLFKYRSSFNRKGMIRHMEKVLLAVTEWKDWFIRRIFEYFYMPFSARLQITNTVTPCFMIIYLTAFCRHCAFYKLKVWNSPGSSKNIGAIFSQ